MYFKRSCEVSQDYFAALHRNQTLNKST